MENTPSRGLGVKLNGRVMVSVHTPRALLTLEHRAVCTLCISSPRTEGKNTVRKTQRMPWLTETNS